MKAIGVIFVIVAFILLIGVIVVDIRVNSDCAKDYPCWWGALK